MEAEEMPKNFTKPGPPIILPNELYSKRTKVFTNKNIQNHQEELAVETKTDVTEL